MMDRKIQSREDKSKLRNVAEVREEMHTALKYAKIKSKLRHI